jgi:hypothetical protein
LRLGARVFAGRYAAPHDPPRQRRIAVAGADPYETFTNPLLRSRGALFVRSGFHYHAPGNAGLRAFRSDLGGRWAASASLELSRPLVARRRGVLRGVTVFGFADGGLVDSRAVPASDGSASATALWDGGVGVTGAWRLGDLAWTTRVELPLLVNRWEYAADVDPQRRRLALRWQVSLEPSF